MALTGTVSRTNAKLGGYLFAIMSSNTQFSAVANGDLDSIKDNDNISFNGTVGGGGSEKTYSSTYNSDTYKKFTGALSIAHNITGRYVRIFFGTWSTTGGYGNVSVSNVNITLTRTGKSYNIAYDKNAADATGAVSSTAHKFMFASNVSSNLFARPGYKQTGWNTAADGSGQSFALGGSTGTSDSQGLGLLVKNALSGGNNTVTLYAVWAPLFGLVYHLNGQGSDVTYFENADAGTTMTLLTASTLPSNFVNNGYYFVGWADNASSDVSIGTSIVAGANGTTRHIYAIWKPINYTVAYNGNGSTYGSMASDTGTYSGAFTIKTNAFDKTDAFFKVWQVDSTLGSYADKATISSSSFAYILTAAQNGNKALSSVTITFYAQWYTDLEYGKNAGNSGKWGSATNPYIIRTTQHLSNLSAIVNGTQSYIHSIGKSYAQATSRTYQNCYFILANSLTLSGTFTPIGKSGAVFSGTFDGENRTISNVTVNIGSYAGLFGYISNATINNLTVSYMTLSGGNNTGGIAGYAHNSSIGGCTVTGTLNTSIDENTPKLSVDSYPNAYDIVEWDCYPTSANENQTKINDGSTSTKFCSTNKGAMIFILQVKTSMPIAGFAIVNANDTASVTNRVPTGIEIWGSNTNNQTDNYNTGGGNTPSGAGKSGWTSVFSNMSIGMPTTNYARKVFSFSSFQTYNYYWVRVTGNGNIQFSEFELFTVTNTGGIVGYANNSTIANSQSTAKITGNYNVGGIAGASNGSTFDNCTNGGQVNGQSYVGGVIGLASNDIVSNSANTRSISGGTGYGYAGIVGSIVAASSIEIYNCTNSGDITADANGVAGILGHTSTAANKVKVSGCSNTANVSARINAGGMGGRIETQRDEGQSLVFVNCYNSGNISTAGGSDSNGTVGGIVGYLFANGTTAYDVGTISYCVNTGTITDDNNYNVGGIAGSPRGTEKTSVRVFYCYTTTGQIAGTNLATVDNTSYRVATGTTAPSLTNGGRYILYQTSMTFKPLAGSTQLAWTDIVSNNINGFYIQSNVENGKYFVSTLGVGGVMLTPDVLTSTGSNPYTVTAEYRASRGNNIYVNKADIVQASVTETYDKTAHHLADPSLPSGYTFSTLYFVNSDFSGVGTADPVNANTYYSITDVFIGSTIVGKRADSSKSVLTIAKLGIKFTHTWTDGKYGTQLNRVDSNPFVYNADFQGLTPDGISFYGIEWDHQSVMGSFPSEVHTDELFAVTYTEPNQSPDSIGFEYMTTGNYFRKYVLLDTDNCYIWIDKNTEVTELEYSWTIAKNKLTVQNVWSSDNVGTNPYGFTFNGKAQGLAGISVVAETDTAGATHTPADSVYSHTYDISTNVGSYGGTFTLIDTSNYTLDSGKLESYVASVAAANKLDSTNGVSLSGAVVTYSWKINQFDIASAIAGYTGGKAWFGGNSDENGLVVSNQSTVRTDNVGGTEYSYFYLQDKQDDVLPILVYENANYTKNNFVLYIKYTTNINVANGDGRTEVSLAKIRLGTDFTIDDLTQAGDAHVANATVTARGIGNFTGKTQKFYTVLNSDFGGRMTEANWGSQNNPYVIENPVQLIRLSQIVNGGVAWNSVNSADKNVALAQNANAVATGRSYANSYFVVSASYSGTIAQSTSATTGDVTGFEPIGSNAYPFAAVRFAREGDSNVVVRYSYNNPARDYVGLFGYINGTHIFGIDVKGVGTVEGASFVGGIVGYANGGRIEDCSFAVSASAGQQEIKGASYVGGIAGYANGTAIIDNDNDTNYGTYMSAKVSGTDFVGGLVGYWKVTDGAQVNGTKNMLTYANAFSVAGSGDFAGGIAGVLDANLCTTDLTYLAFYTNGVYVNGTDNVMDVYGVNYVGALFGALFGNGYHNSATDSGPRTVLVINEPDDVRANVVANGAGYVMGGLVGYAQGVGILFGCDWENSAVTVSTGTVANKGVYVNTNGYNVSFVGGLVGVMGKNSTVESVRQEVSVSGGSVIVAGGQYTVTNRVATKGYNFVGGIFGYISSNAGTYFGTTGTILGNSIALVNNAEVNGRAFVGGIAGGLGLVENYSSYVGSDTYDLLKNLLSATHNTDEGILGYSTLEEDPYTANPFGRVINLANVTGSDRYVGGIFGYVGSRVNLVLENALVSTTTNDGVLDNPSAYLNVFNGNAGKSGLQQVQIKGVSYVGGITGWLDNQAHTLTYVVNRAVVWGTSTTDSYVGGLVGYMNAGTIENCISVATEQVRVATDTYKGANYVGGLVGYIVGGKIVGSISTGFMFSSVGLNAGGVIGNGISPTIENTWTVYLGQNATYSTVSGNGRGKYVLVDSRIATATGETVPTFVRLERMVGLYTADIASGTLEIIVNVPPRSGRTLNNKQLVFYDASGEDSVTQNAFARFENSNNRLTMGLTMSSADSMIVSIVDAEFKNIANYKGTDTDGKNANALKGYRAPSNSMLYTADVVQSTYDTDGRITGVWANLYFFNGTQNVLIGAYQQEDGTINRDDEGYVGNYKPGDESSPYIISTQAEWNEFAYSIYTGQKDYSDKFVKLNTDIVISAGTHKDTNGNTLNFSAEVTPNNNASDSKNSKSNSGYNLAGNIAQGYDGSVYQVTVNGTTGSVTPSFKGTFDGNGHTITINSTNYNHRMSVFPNAGGGSTTFKNLTILGSIKAGTSTSDAAYDVAGFVGKPFGAIRFENCTNAANVQGLRLVAGFTGVSSSSSPITLVGCVNKGNITSYEGSSWNKGWLQEIGYPVDYAYGTGGFIARADANITIESCINMGSVIAPTKVGGLVGRVSGSSSSATTIYIKNCANTGYIEGNEHNAYNTDDKKITANAWARAGGLIGEVDQYSQLYMYASYNTGNVRGHGSIVGGLVGILGTIPDDEKPHSAVSNYTSYIYYCYNTGTITAGYKINGGIPRIGTSGYNINGTDAGGLVGVAVKTTINYCFNTGDIHSRGGCGYALSWQVRNGGIVAEVCTKNSGCSVKISNCYNTGRIFIEENTSKSDTRYSADIVGYMEYSQGSDSTKIIVENCYAVAQNIILYNNGIKYFSGWNSQSGGDSGCVRYGTILNSRADLTAVLNEDGTVKPVSKNTKNENVTLWTASTESLTNNDSYNSGTASGYIYIQGCLPQLAVFAVDTHNGLSMRSVNYGKNLYGEYVQQSAGNQFSPFVIKDGIDLLGVQALVDLGYNFAGKYIEFANASNNITMDTTVASVVTKRIEMSTNTSTTTKISDSSFKSASTENGTADQEGKSYYLFKYGACCYNPGVDYNNSTLTNDSSAFTTWISRNYAYDQSSASYTNNATYSRSNFLPIGRNNGYNTVFRGSISGKQADGSNTEVANLRIVSSGSDYAFAGLFARAENANISNITVSGQVYSYATSASGTSMAGGIVANLSGKSVVDGCIAGSSSRQLYVTAYGKNNSYSSTTVDKLTTYAGGIVGVGNTSYQTGSTSYKYDAGTTGTVKNCNVVNATVQSAKNNIGGIVGFVASSSLTGSVTAKDKNNKFEITDNAVSNATLYALSASGTSNADIGTRVGGIIGYSGQYTSVIISGCSVGTSSTTTSVTIRGENALGGIAGAMPDAINEIKDCSVNASTLIERDSWGNVQNVSDSSVGDSGNHGTAIGGIVGHTYQASGIDPVTLTIGGKVVFAGTISIGYASVGDAVRNVGGIVGDMCSGASFATGAKVNVTGTISVSSSITQTAGNENNSGVRNIGGIAGRTRDVAFSGEFTVSANVSIPNAYNVGGFIGRNRGVVNILADDTIIKIGGTVSGSHDVGGFIGNNSADDNSVLYIGANEYRRTRYERPLSIEISAGAKIVSTGDNVGGIVGNNFSRDGTGKGYIQIVKGSITNKGSVQGANAVGGIIGNNNANLVTGGGTGPYAELTIVNAGQVTGSGNYVGGVIGLLNRGSIAGTFINNGDVTGKLFVGGSIGYVASDATITVAGGVATEFKNGSQDDAISSSDALTADGEAVAQGTGTVIGQAYVGGSIGIMLGSIVGTSGAKVVFTSSGKVDATDVQGYLGGSIGALAGRVSYAQFISAGDKMSGISAVTAVGGSVGLIGLPVGLGGTAHQTIVVDNSHFESNGNLSLTGAKVSEASNGKGEFEWGGVGGAIGVIGGDGQGLDNGYNNDFAGGSNWHDNTYYAQGNVSAPGINNVGGIVGLIRADGIKINNMLAYDITVSGATNVGGIVGATIGSGTVIEYAYSISTTDDKGLFTASAQDGQAGGIIGKALADTDASTSYWVKGYKNAELASTDASKLKDTLGLFTAITEVVNGTTIIFTKELVGGASDAESEESSEESAIYPRPYDYIDAVGEHAVGGQTVTLDYTCVKDENGNITSYKDWTWYFSTYYTDAEFINDTWVLRKPDWKAYSTGTEQTGWYFVYANDTVSEDIVGTVDALHQSSVRVGSLTDKDFWKRIANAYTKEEIESGEDTALLYSTLASNIIGETVSSGGLVQHNNLYATATSARTTKSGYYLYIASSGSSRPTAIHDSAEDKFYIQINTAIDKMTIAKNVAVYYRSFAMGSALTYNGYERYAPISLQKDIPAEPGIAQGNINISKKNTYAYTTQLVGATIAKDVGTYKSNVFVYYYDNTGKAYKVGGITQGAWKIKQRVLTVEQNKDLEKTYGDPTGIQAKYIIKNISSADLENINFELTINGLKDKNNNLYSLTINGMKPMSSYNDMTDPYKDKMQGITVFVSRADAEGSLSNADASFTAEDLSAENKKTYKVEIVVTFKKATAYTLNLALYGDYSKTNYTMNSATQKVTVLKKAINVKIADNYAPVKYDGQYNHGSTWTMSGLIVQDGYDDTWASVLQAFSPQFVANVDYLNELKTSSLLNNTSLSYDNVNIQHGVSLGRTESSSVTFSGAGDVGLYYLLFSNYGKNDDNNNSNYYINLVDGKSQEFVIGINTLHVRWEKQGNGAGDTYDGTSVGTITANITADNAIEDLATFVGNYFARSWSGKVGGEIKVTASSKQNAKITFTTKADAGTYTAQLHVNDQTDKDKINCPYKFENGTKVDDYTSRHSYTINKRPFDVSFVYKDNKQEYTYDTTAQGLTKVNIVKVNGNNNTGLVNNDSISLKVVVNGDVYVPYGYGGYSTTPSTKGSISVSPNTIDAGTYTVSVTLSSGSNYTFAGASDTWKINKKTLSLGGLSNSTKVYDGEPFKPSLNINGQTVNNGTYTYGADTITVKYTATSTAGNAFVNVGEYNVSIGGSNSISAKRDSKDTTENYKVDGTASAKYTITARPITVKWNPTQTFIYNGQLQGITLASAEGGGQVKLTSCDVSSAQITGYAGGDVIHLTLGGGKVHVKDIPFAMTAAIDRVTGKNSDGSNSVAENYTLIVDTAENDGTYNIVAASLSLEYTSGGVIKEYDATVSANVSDLTFRVVSNTAATLPQSSFKITGVYLDKHVGNDKTVKVTVKCNDTSGDFAYVGADTFEIANVGSITPKELEVKLDKLRSGKATRVYNGATWYGGEKGAMYSSGTSARSAVYRSGEGFVVDGFPSAEQNGTVIISAVYKEADASRSAFDSYVNFVYEMGGVYKKGTYTSGLFKTLVFAISGDCAGNYTFTVQDSGANAFSDTIGSSTQNVVVYDSRDDANKDKRPSGASTINIEITVKTYKVNYNNTSQSYANSDNTYNTDWLPVEATNAPDGTQITVLNGWMYENGTSGDKKVYKQYTVIRGRTGSTQLSAQVSGEKGMELNYNMSNQPILTIGYFVDSTDFEVGSIASLMIASYYWYASQHADSPDFNPIVSAGSEWVKLATSEEYAQGSFTESNRPSDAPKDCDTWDAYFAFVEQDKNVTVFLNEYEGNTWGYYTTTQSTSNKTYTSYKQTADISGVVTATDIAILDSFFTVYVYNEDGSTSIATKTWGAGGDYITNFIKPSVGNVLTAVGSVFVSTEGGFGGTYNGSGYVIEYLNILGFGDATQNVGMFDKIGTGSVSGLHLRNISISANGGNVGGIAGEILAGEASVSNVSFHGTVNVNSTSSATVGALFGKSARDIDKAIVLGTITASGTNVTAGGAIGKMSGALSNVVSLVQVDSTGTVGAISGNNATATNSFHMQNAVLKRDGSTLTFVNVSGQAISYASLMGGSVSGYGASKYYYDGTASAPAKGTYDMLDDVAITTMDVESKSNPRQSMRLRDVVDVYLLMYSLSETTATGANIGGARVYEISSSSWLVGTKHGTSSSDAIVIANVQNVALLRQLRFATFILDCDVTSDASQKFDGAFYGSVYQNGHSIAANWLDGMFEKVVDGAIVTA